jgi:hypothetical protein
MRSPILDEAGLRIERRTSTTSVNLSWVSADSGSRVRVEALPITLILPHGARHELGNEDARQLARRLWQVSAAGAGPRGTPLAAAIADAFVGDFTVEVREVDVGALRAVLFRLGATMSLSPGLAALDAALEQR